MLLGLCLLRPILRRRWNWSLFEMRSINLANVLERKSHRKCVNKRRLQNDSFKREEFNLSRFKNKKLSFPFPLCCFSLEVERLLPIHFTDTKLVRYYILKENTRKEIYRSIFFTSSDINIVNNLLEKQIYILYIMIKKNWVQEGKVG